MVKNPPEIQETWVQSPGQESTLEGNGYPLQYSCLENSMNRGAWQATVHGVAKSDTTERLTHTPTHFNTQLTVDLKESFFTWVRPLLGPQTLTRYLIQPKSLKDAHSCLKMSQSQLSGGAFTTP